MSNDYFKAQGWFKTYALNSQDSRGVFQQLVKEDEEAFRLASAETDKIKAMMNEKYGPGTVKYGSEIKQPEIKTPQAAFEFSQRNPAAEGGRMLNAVQMGEAMGNRTGFATPQGTGVQLTKEKLQLLKDNLTKEEFKKLKFGEPRKKTDLDIGVKQRDNKSLWRKVTNILEPGKASSGVKILNNEKLSNALIKSTNAGDDIKTIITKMNKLDKSLSRNQISSAINALVARKQIDEDFGRVAGKNLTIGDQQAYNKIIEEAVDEGKLNRAQIARKAGVSDSVVEDWIKANKGDEFYKKNFDYETGRLKTGNLQTRKDLFKFVENSDKITAKEISERFNLDSKKTQTTLSDLVGDIYRMRTREGGSIVVPYDEPDRLKNVLDKIRDAPDFEDIYQRRIGDLVASAYPKGSKAQKQAMKSLSEYYKFSRALKEKFPELGLSLDHVVPFQFLKEVKQGENPINLIKVKPTVSAVNRFKTNFDNARIELNRLNKIDPNNPDVKKRLKLLNDLQKNIGIEFGGISKGGYVYNFGAQPVGKSDLISDATKVIDDYQKVGNFSKKVLADEKLQKQLIEAGVDTGKDMSVFKSIKPFDKKKLKEIEKSIKPFDKKKLKEIESYITDRTGKVKQPMFSSGFAGAYEMLSDDLKAIVNSDGYKKFANSKAGKTLSMAAKTPGKLFGIGDILIGYLDYTNNKPMMSKAKAYENMLQAMSFGIYRGGDKQNLEEIKTKFIENGGDGKIFDQVVDLNKSNFKMKGYIENIKKSYKDLSSAGYEDMAKKQMKSALNNVKTMGEKNLDKFAQYKTDLAVSESGGPIQIKDITQPIKDTKKAAFDLFEEEQIKNYPSTYDQVNTESGPVAEQIYNSILTKDSYKKLLPQNLPSTVNQLLGLNFKPVTEKEKEAALIQEMKKNAPQELYRYNKEFRGMNPDEPMTIEETANFMNKNKKAIGFAEGGITGLRSKYEYKK